MGKLRSVMGTLRLQGVLLSPLGLNSTVSLLMGSSLNGGWRLYAFGHSSFALVCKGVYDFTLG